MTAPAIPTFSGPVPLRTQTPAEFDSNAALWLAYQSTIATDYNSLGEYMNALSIAIDANSITSANAALTAESSANFKGKWSVLTGALAIPSSVAHEGSTWQLLNDIADVTASEPSSTADWQAITLSSFGSLITSNFTSAAGQNHQINATANTVDIAIPALTIGDFFTLHNHVSSTFKVQVLNPTQTITGKNGSIAAGVNMELAAGESVQLVAKSTTALTIVGALV